MTDWCLAVDGGPFDCDSNPPDVESAPEGNIFQNNILVNNGTDPDPSGGALVDFAADIMYIVPTSEPNCFSGNEYLTKTDPFNSGIFLVNGKCG